MDRGWADAGCDPLMASGTATHSARIQLYIGSISKGLVVQTVTLSIGTAISSPHSREPSSLVTFHQNH